MALSEISLFTGCGGGLLGSKLLGWRTVCAVERNPYRQACLIARQADGLLDPFPIWDNCNDFDGTRWRGCADIVSAGFPCQPFSVAGKRAGADDERNGWPATIRIIREVGPRIAWLENVPGLLSTPYWGTILGDLAESGFDARWCVVSAADAGAPHRRERLWVLAYATESRSNTGQCEESGAVRDETRRQEFERRSGSVADTEPDGRRARSGEPGNEGCKGIGRGESAGSRGERMVLPAKPGLEGLRPDAGQSEIAESRNAGASGLADAECSSSIGRASQPGRQPLERIAACWPSRPGERQHWWEPPRLIQRPRAGEPLSDVGGSATWLATWMERFAFGDQSHIVMGYEHERITSSIQDMRILQNGFGQEAVQRDARRPGKVQAEEVLQHEVHGTCQDNSGPVAIDAPQEEQEIGAADTMRAMRNAAPTWRASHGWQSSEQFSSQFEDVLRCLPHEMALGERQKAEARKALPRLWKEITTARPVSKTLVQIQEIWRSQSDKKIRWAWAVLLGPCFAERMNLFRRERLSAIGDGQVPQSMVLAWRYLTNGFSEVL